MVLLRNILSWTNVVAISMDNTSVNFGRRSGILTVYKGNFAHTCMEWAVLAIFIILLNKDIRLSQNHQVLMYLCYWFDKSTKRKAEVNWFFSR